MAEFHVTAPGRELTLSEPEQVVELVTTLDAGYAREGRRVLVGIDAVGASLDVGLGALHTALMVTTEDEPGWVAVGSSTSDEEVEFEFDGATAPVPAANLINRDQVFAALREFLDTEARPTSLAWDEF